MVCWGWKLVATYTANATSGSAGSYAYSSYFYSGVGYVDLSTSLPAAANFGTDLWSNLVDMGTYDATTGYGFSNVYWMGDDDTSAWPSSTLVYRF